MYYPTMFFHSEKLFEDNLPTSNNGNILVHIEIELSHHKDVQAFQGFGKIQNHTLVEI